VTHWCIILNMKYLLLITLFITSCVSAPKAQFYERTIPFDATSLSWVLESGNSSIYGNSFISDNLAINQGPHTCAGYEVNLVPVNSYYEEVLGLVFDNFDNSFWDRNTQSYDWDVVDEEGNYTKQTTCDSQGNFEFTEIAKGNYYIITAVSYEGGPFRTFPPSWKGGWLLKKIYVDGIKDKKVVIAR
jgi:hypothetical protein